MRLKENHSITIIIPVYNVISFLSQAIQSAAKQKYSNKEIIVIDDGSDEKYREEIKNICKEFGNIKLFHIDHSGVAVARVYGVSVSSADYIVFLDADDILLPHALDYFAKAIKPGIAAVYADYVNIDERNRLLKKPKKFPRKKLPEGKQVLYELLEGEMPFCNGSICINKEVLQSLPPDNYNLSHGEDWVVWCHLAFAGDIILAGYDIVAHIRKHKENVTKLLFRDPSSIYSAIEIIYKNPVFIQILGTDKAEILRKKSLSGINLYIASNYAKHSDKANASLYLEKAEMLLSEIK